MSVRIVRVNACDVPRSHSRYVTPAVLWGGLILLLCAVTLPLGGAEQTGALVRPEAPFPVIVSLASAVQPEPVRYEVLRGDFHMHTTHSDGSLSPAERVLEAWQYGYDVVAITDHRNFRAYEEALPVAQSLDVLLLRGMETGINAQEHLVALDFSPEYTPRQPHQWAETQGRDSVFYQQQWGRLCAAGGFVLYPHPHVGLREPVLWAMGQGLLGGIEVKNDVVGSDWNAVESHGTDWYPFAFNWALEYNLTLFANSDIHDARGDVDQAITLVLAETRSRDGVMEALRGARTVAWFNNMLCAHPWVFDLLMPSLVDIHRVQFPGGRAFLRLQNHGPVSLTAQVGGMPLGQVALGPYEDVLVGARRIPDAVSVTWKNLYVSPHENLITHHSFSEAAP